MKTRDAVLQYQRTCKDTETVTIDLDIVEPISAFDFELQCTNGATSNKGNYLSDICTKVEVVDGSDVLESLNFSQLQALHFYKTQKVPAMYYSEGGGGTQRGGCQLLFGRYLWDPLFALDAKKFTNPQLKVTFNKAAIRAAGATGFASGDNILLTVVAKVFEDGIAPTKFLMQKQIDSFTSAASGEKRVDLPIDYTYRALLMRLWLQGSDIDEIISDAKLTCDTDKFIPFNRKVKQLDREIEEMLGEITWKHMIKASDGSLVRTVLNKEPNVLVHDEGVASSDIIHVHSAFSSQYYIDNFTHAGVAVTVDHNLWTIQTGHALHACLPYFFGRPSVPEDWFNPTAYKKVELVLTQAVANAVCEIVLEQVRPL